MYLKWIGLMFLILSLILGAIISTNLQVPQKVYSYAVVPEDNNSPVVDRIVPVPPLNRTEEQAWEQNTTWGWVGFNISLPNQEKTEYEAYGIILPDNPAEKPEVEMRVINETGLAFLLWSGMEEAAWNASKIYTVAILSANLQHFQFRFRDLDNCPKYCVLFRGLKNGTDDSLILITIKESWYEGRTLIPATSANIGIVGATTVLGLSLTAIGFRPKQKKRLRKGL